MERRRLILLGSLVLGLCFIIPLSVTYWFASHKVVRVVLLAGDDNVEGYAKLDNLEQFLNTHADDERIQSRFVHLREATPANGDTVSANWTTRDDVFVFYERERHKPWESGPLNMLDYGAGPGLFGPEVEIGHTLGEAFDEPVVIVKAGFTKKSLAEAWRSPSRVKKDHRRLGYSWVHTLDNLNYALRHVGEVLGPSYRRHRTQFAGVIWWHGYSDAVINDWLYSYEEHLRMFLLDLRDSLKRPHLPIVVAKAGAGGRDTDTFFFEEPLRTAQDNVCKDLLQSDLPTRCVDTFPYVHNQEAHVDRNVHYYGHGDTMIEIGGVLGEALTELYYQQLDSHELQEEIEADYNEYVEETEINVLLVLLVCTGIVMAGVAVYRGQCSVRSITSIWNRMYDRVYGLFFGFDDEDPRSSRPRHRHRRSRRKNRKKKYRRRRGNRHSPLSDIQEEDEEDDDDDEEEEDDYYEDEYNHAGTSEMTPQTSSRMTNGASAQRIEAGEEFKSPIPTNNSALVELDSSSEDENGE